MKTNRILTDDAVDRQTVLDYLQRRPGEHCEEAEVSLATGVAKMHIRRLLRGMPGIDEGILNAGKVCWNAPADTTEP